MSDFMGVTFPLQKVTPSDFAIVNRAALTDGILSGCVLSYAGTGLTMEAGDLLICGRHIRHPAAQTWTVDGASSGFARLILTIDTTKTSTLDAFDMVEASIEYATSEEGFAALMQEDINVDGTRYQMTACIVSLSSGGINDIVQQLPAASAKGTGGVNFKVVGGTTRPADPAENTIWVNTDLEITKVVFSNSEPLEYDTGTVWIKTGYSSNGYLNISPEGLINIYPTECYQYIDDSGSKTQRTAETFRSGKWRDWGTYLYKDGNEFVELTGGWEISGGYGGYSIALTDEDIHISFAGSTSNQYYVSANTKNKVDLTNISRLVLNEDWNGANLKDSNILKNIMAVSSDTKATECMSFDQLRSIGVAGIGEVYSSCDEPQNVLDVSSLKGSYYINVYSFNLDMGYSDVRGEISVKFIKME